MYSLFIFIFISLLWKGKGAFLFPFSFFIFFTQVPVFLKLFSSQQRWLRLLFTNFGWIPAQDFIRKFTYVLPYHIIDNLKFWRECWHILKLAIFSRSSGWRPCGQTDWKMILSAWCVIQNLQLRNYVIQCKVLHRIKLSTWWTLLFALVILLVSYYLISAA